MLKSTSEATSLKIRSHTLTYQTERGPQFIDITDPVARLVEQSGVENGFVIVFSKHTTAAITINESEPHLISDMEAMLARMLPEAHDYGHNTYAHGLDNGERPNGHSHCQNLLLGTSENIPIIDGSMVFGQWQRVFLVELDRPRDRKVLVNVVGVKK